MKWTDAFKKATPGLRMWTASRDDGIHLTDEDGINRSWIGKVPKGGVVHTGPNRHMRRVAAWHGRDRAAQQIYMHKRYLQRQGWRADKAEQRARRDERANQQ